MEVPESRMTSMGAEDEVVREVVFWAEGETAEMEVTATVKWSWMPVLLLARTGTVLRSP
jgi:hypothetical protein